MKCRMSKEKVGGHRPIGEGLVHPRGFETGKRSDQKFPYKSLTLETGSIYCHCLARSDGTELAQ